MKNLFFALAFMLVGTFAFANTDVISEVNNDVNKVEKIQNQDSFNFFIESESLKNLSLSSTIQFEILSGEDYNYPCKWRICTYRNGVRVRCSEWTYGECLKEVLIVAKR